LDGLRYKTSTSGRDRGQTRELEQYSQARSVTNNAKANCASKSSGVFSSAGHIGGSLLYSGTFRRFALLMGPRVGWGVRGEAALVPDMWRSVLSCSSSRKSADRKAEDFARNSSIGR